MLIFLTIFNIKLLHEVCLNVLKSTQNLFLKDERPSYSYVLNYLVYMESINEMTVDLICQLHGPIPLCPFNNVLQQILQVIERLTHILYGIDSSIESAEECLLQYRSCHVKKQSITRFILTLLKDLFSHDDWRQAMAQFLRRIPFPAELMRQRNDFREDFQSKKKIIC